MRCAFLSFHTRGTSRKQKLERSGGRLRSQFNSFHQTSPALRPLLLSTTNLVAMASGQPLPKFGDWDVNNPATAEGFTAIFNIARDEKKTGGNAGAATPSRNEAGGLEKGDTYQYPRKSWKWFCCG